MKDLLKYCFYSTVILGIIFSCEGPEGPMGPEGPIGPIGVQGEPGAQGEPGTANVFYSDWLNFDYANWSDLINFYGQNRREYTVDEMQITEDILNKGTVLVFVKFSGASNKIIPLPLTLVISGGKIQEIAHYLELNKIVLIYFNQDDNLDPGTIPSGNSFRYVIIPGGIPISGTKSGLDLMNYEAVKAYYNIPD